MEAPGGRVEEGGWARRTVEPLCPCLSGTDRVSVGKALGCLVAYHEDICPVCLNSSELRFILSSRRGNPGKAVVEKLGI